ncbi:MAG: sigma-70 family RNA polymerase sigma factor [Oscillospiraceae bacterium]|nr:sigma-70 family RNA polymerase sigma factor [Oscillospiraceae bacterium]
MLSIIRDVLAGNTDAFEDIVRAYERNVYNIALRMSGNREDALDISQESFLKAYHSLHSFRGDSKFSVWLYRIVSNTCLDFLRERKRRAEVPLVRENGEGETEDAQVADESLSPETLFERRQTREALRRGLESLPEDQRKILLLREIQGFSYEEIGSILSLESGTVKSRIFRARRKLCEFLSGDGNISLPSSSTKTGGGDKP